MYNMETERVQRIWDKMAPGYDKQIEFYEKFLFSGGREWVCSQAKGKVLEIGFGTGRNLPHYPQNVKVTGIELSPAMLEIAKKRTQDLGRNVEMVTGDAQDLPFPNNHFDTVVSTLSLCSIPDDRKAIQEAKRVLKPGGQFLLLEHVRSPLLPIQLVQRILDFFTVRFEGDHMLREPLNHLKTEGFNIEKVQRLKLGIVELVVARKPN